jgi:hypothetical protein
MKYYSGCSATINRANGTIESPAYGVTGYPPNQVTEHARLVVRLSVFLSLSFPLFFSNCCIVFLRKEDYSILKEKQEIIVSEL